MNIPWSDPESDPVGDVQRTLKAWRDIANGQGQPMLSIARPTLKSLFDAMDAHVAQAWEERDEAIRKCVQLEAELIRRRKGEPQ